MESSDQKANRSKSGGNSSQPKKSVSEAKSSAKSTDAKSDVTDWKDGAEASGMATETKMGMAIVVILVLAFGMLVYHKFDLKQQQLANIEGSASSETGEENTLPQQEESPAESGSEEAIEIAALGRQQDVHPGVQRSALADLESTAFTFPDENDRTSPAASAIEGTAVADEGEPSFFDLTEPAVAEDVNEIPDSEFEFVSESTPQESPGSESVDEEFPSFDEPVPASQEAGALADGAAVNEEPDPFAFLEAVQAERNEPELLFPPDDLPPTKEGDSATLTPEPEFASFEASDDRDKEQPATGDDVFSAPDESSGVPFEANAKREPALAEFDLLPAAAEDVAFDSESASPADDFNELVDSHLSPPSPVEPVDFGSSVATEEERPTQPEFDLSQELSFDDNKPENDVLIAMAEPAPQENPFADSKESPPVSADTFPSRGADSNVGTLPEPDFPVTTQFEPRETRPQPDPRHTMFETPRATTTVRNAAYDADPGKIRQVSLVADKCDITEVRPDDNYWKISKRMYGTARYFSALALYNRHRISDPKKLRPGMKVLIPDPKVLEKKYPELFVDAKRKQKLPAGFFLQKDGAPAYRVGDRETLSEISQKHLGRASRWIQIYRMNQKNLTDPNKLKPGTVLTLPDDATDVHLVP